MGRGMLKGIINGLLGISLVGGFFWLAYASLGVLGLILFSAIALIVFCNSGY
jgi:hypothetical protein